MATRVGDALGALGRRPAPRLAVFDRAIREHVGQWRLAEPVPVDGVLAAAVVAGDPVPDAPGDGAGPAYRVPLHAAEDASLDGTYLLYYPEAPRPHVAYHDYAEAAPATIAVDELPGTLPAWRLRFFTDDVDPPAEPGYAGRGPPATATGAGDVPASGGAGPAGSDGATGGAGSRDRAASGSRGSGSRGSGSRGLLSRALALVPGGAGVPGRPTDGTASEDPDGAPTGEREAVATGPAASAGAGTETTGETGGGATPAAEPAREATDAGGGDTAAVPGTGGIEPDAGEWAGTADAPPPPGLSGGPDAEVGGGMATAGTQSRAQPRTGEGERSPPVAPGEDGDLDPFEAARRHVEREREAARETVRERFADLGPDAYVARHDGVPEARPAGRWHDEELGQVCGLAVTDEHGETRADVDVRAECGIYEGNEVLVTTRRGGDGLPVEAEVLAIEGSVLHLGVYWDTAVDKARAEQAFERGGEASMAVARLLNPTPFDRLVDGIADCEARDRFAAVVRGEREPAFGEESPELGASAPGLNEYQAAAVRGALAAEDVYAVHGPPGTGKTRTLVALVREAVDRGDRVLAVAHSNQAVDNLLAGTSTADWTDPRSLHARAAEGEFTMARAGSNGTSELVEREYGDESAWRADVVGATTNGAHEFVADGFDLVVVDEAAQAAVASTLLAASRGSTLVLAGDHRQLPPYTASEANEDAPMAASLFERLVGRYGESAAAFLGRQYRMHEAIAAFPNAAFYDGRLETAPECAERTVGDLAPLVGRQIDGAECSAPGSSIYNEAEATAAAREVARLLRAGLSPGSIGVITPYSAQVGKIVGELRGLDYEDVADAVDVDTVDSFQGGEREAIVVSLVRANDRGEVGFLGLPEEGPRRLNVALTRAKRRLVVLGDFETLAASDREGAWALAALAEHLEGTGTME